MTNLKNNAKYVGQTKNLKRRMDAHVSDSRSNATTRKISLAIREYGIENFSVKILEDNIDPSLLNKKEEEWIKKLNTVVPPNYNTQVKVRRKSQNKNYNNSVEKLSDAEISHVISALKEFKSIDDVSEICGISKQLVSMVNRGKIGRNNDTTYPIIPTQKLSKLNWEKVRQIQQYLLDNKFSLKKLSEMYNVSVTTIYNINKGKIYKDFRLTYPISCVEELSNYKISEREYDFIVDQLKKGMLYKHISEATGSKIKYYTISEIDKGKSYALYQKTTDFPIRKKILKTKESKSNIESMKNSFSLIESLNNDESH